MKRSLIIIASLLLLYSCELIESPTSVNKEITSPYLINGNLDSFLENNQVLRLHGKPGITAISIGNKDLSKYEQCFVLHISTGTTSATIVSSAVIKLDDIVVLSTSDFSKKAGEFKFQICDLMPTSVLSVKVEGKPNSYINVWIEGKLKGSLSDIDGNVYKTVIIGDQTWMAENLKTTKNNDGSPIPFITDGSAWIISDTPAYSWYDNDIANKNGLGALYNWYSVNTGKLCPAGWHVPSQEEWGILHYYLYTHGYGYGGVDWKTAKSMAATSGWNVSTTDGAPGSDQASNNSTGFTGKPGGYRSEYGWFGDKGDWAYWWSSTDGPEGFPAGSILYNNSESPGVTYGFKVVGFSVRCVKN